MLYLRHVTLESVLSHAGIAWERKLPTFRTPANARWVLATPVRDAEMPLDRSKFFKSLKDECNDPKKRGSLTTMAMALQHAIAHDDYRTAIKGVSGIMLKEAFGFPYRNANHKVWELKYQNKDRLYFFSHNFAAKEPLQVLVPLLFHHKKDQTTPEHVTSYCGDAMKPFLDPSPKITILKE